MLSKSVKLLHVQGFSFAISRNCISFVQFEVSRYMVQEPHYTLCQLELHDTRAWLMPATMFEHKTVPNLHPTISLKPTKEG